MSGTVAATTITLASFASILRQNAQTAATTQTATSARANSSRPSRQVAIAVVSAKANVSAGPTRLAARTSAPDKVERLKLHARRAP